MQFQLLPELWREGGDGMSIITHIIAAIIGGTVGVLAMALCIAGRE